MSFNKKNFNELYQAMEAEARRRLPELTDYQEGSVVRSLFESFAVELGVLYEQMDRVYNSAFIDTASGVNLDRIVAVLGIRRNEPDFATGVVTFQRSSGLREKVMIPAGTIVTTPEDKTSDTPVKVYATIEEVLMETHETSVEVRIMACVKGKAMKSGSETVTVMPRPVPGIKSVTNKQPVRFLGKDGETDEDLRSRAKQMLLASGRSNITSIENALFSLSGIREVRVNELFELFKITEESITNIENQLIQKEEPSVVINALKADLNAVRNIEFISDHEFSQFLKGQIQKEHYDRFLPLILINSRFLNPGVIEVFVDGLTDENYNDITIKIDEVRAAGIYARLKPAIPVNLETVLKIGIEERLTVDEGIQLENEVRDVIIDFIDAHRLGQPLIFSQLTGKILAVKGITDLEDFEMTSYREAEQFATGTITVSRENTNVVQLQAPVTFTTALGGQYRVFEDIQFLQDEVYVEVTAQAVKAGREGELFRTGDAIQWEPLVANSDTYQVSNGTPILLPREMFLAEDKRIAIQLFERLTPEKIMVAAGIKDRLVRARITLESVDASIAGDKEKLQPKVEEILTAINEFLDDFETQRQNGEKTFFTELDIMEVVEGIDQINSVALALFERPHQSPLFSQIFLVEPSIVEKAVVDQVFVYSDRLELHGEIGLVFSLTASSEEKTRSKTALLLALRDYLDNLQPEEDVTFESLETIAASIEGVLRVELDPKHFSLTGPDGAIDYTGTRIDDKGEKIKIEALEKLYLADTTFVIKV